MLNKIWKSHQMAQVNCVNSLTFCLAGLLVLDDSLDGNVGSSRCSDESESQEERHF